MRYVISAMLLAIFATAAMAAADPATQPATQPAAADLYLIPFSPLGGDNSLDWAGKAVQQNLLTDLTKANLHVAPADKSIAETADAQTAAKAAGARFILTGTYQVADTLVRFNGQILDTASGAVVGGISATGAPRDLFTLEDSLSAQAIKQINQLAATVATAKPAAAVPALPPQVVVQIIQPPAATQPGTTSSYQGSALQQYIDSGRTPSQDYNQQVQDSRDRDTYQYNYNNISGTYYGNYGYGYGYGIIYSLPYGYGYGFGYRHNDGDGHHHHDDAPSH